MGKISPQNIFHMFNLLLFGNLAHTNCNLSVRKQFEQESPPWMGGYLPWGTPVLT